MAIKYSIDVKSMLQTFSLFFFVVVAKHQEQVVSKPILKQTGTFGISIIFFPFVSTTTRLPYDYSTLNKEKERLIE